MGRGEGQQRPPTLARLERAPTVTCPIQHLAKRTDLSCRLSTAARTPARVTRWAQNTHDGFSQHLEQLNFLQAAVNQGFSIAWQTVEDDNGHAPSN